VRAVDSMARDVRVLSEEARNDGGSIEQHKLTNFDQVWE
jgi:hypothetical protein